MRQINPGTGQREVVPSQSRVNKKGPCKTALHGPCFVSTSSTGGIHQVNLVFWNAYEYDLDFGTNQALFDASIANLQSGCNFNKLIRPVTINFLTGTGVPPNGSTYTRLTP